MASTSELAWKVRRLLAMSPAEVGLRAVRGLSHRRSRPERPRPQEDIVSPVSMLAESTVAEQLGARVERELTEGVGNLLPGARDAGALEGAMRSRGMAPESVVEAGERILRGDVSAFGWTAIETGKAPDWHRDPVSGGKWPLEYWADLDFRERGVLGDPRYVWEVNRHHHLVTLARAWLLSGDDRYAVRVWDDIRSWVNANPPLFGINWSSPLEIAIRLMSWAMAVDVVGSRGAQEGDAATLVTSVSLQAGHLSDNLSVYASSKNNHLIGEAAGLLVAGAKFPYLRGFGRIASLGRRLIERELGAQVTADGVTREQAFQYQTFVMEFALLSAAAAACLGTSLAPEFNSTVARMARFLDQVCGDTGVPPSVGDEDGGRAYELADAPGRQAARAVAAAAVFTGERELSEELAGDLEPALWLFGPESVAGLRFARRPTASAHFADGGYFVASRGEQHGVIDCGPLGYLSIAAHGHADCLSLSVAHGGRWVLVDPGTCCYHRDGVWRDHFRSTAAHNTVRIDELDQSEMIGPFMWGRRARAIQMAWVNAPEFDYFEGAHDGYRRVAGVHHRRSVVLGRAGYWIVIDRIEGKGSHEVYSTFQLAPSFAREDRAAEGWASFSARASSSAEECTVDFRTWTPEGAEVTVAEGDESPPRGWVSTGFGRKEPAPVLLVSGRLDLPATLVTAIVVSAGERTIDIERVDERTSGSRGVAMEVTHSDGRDLVLVGEPALTGAEQEFRGVLGFTTARADGEISRGLGVREWNVGGSRVRHESVTNLIPTRSTDGRRP